jgi:uncharacterized protein
MNFLGRFFPLLLALTLYFTPQVRAEHAGLTDTRKSPHAIVQPVGLADAQWTTGFWADRTRALRTVHLPAMWELMKGDKHKPYYQHFLIAAGEMEGDYHGAQWNDGDFYKFLEAASASLAAAPDPQLETAVAESIRAIGKAQAADGYIHTPVLIRQRNGDKSAKPFEDRRNFEMYNMGHLLTAACVHHRATGKDDFLAIARKTADFLDNTFRNPTPELARNSVCPSHYMGAVELYRETRDPRYLQLAQTFLDMRNLVEGDDDNQDRIPFLDQREAGGHAVRANYLYAGAADLYLETGNPKLRTVLDAVWNDVALHKLYITGGAGALYDGASPDGSEDQGSIARVHQAYGRNFQLPNTTAHAETCANIGNILWNWRMFLATGEAKYMAVLELALYNSVLSGVSLESPDYCYVNPLRVTDPLPTALRWSRTRVPFVTSWCCPPNVLRTTAEVGSYAYSTSDDAVWVNLYGASTLNTRLAGKPLKVTQKTDYPWSGHVEITVDECPNTAFALKLRVPIWASGSKATINGESIDVELTPTTYAEIRREWKPGDVLEFEAPMPTVLLEAHPLVEETKGQVCVKRGPLVYCLESPDLPPGVRVADVVLPRDARLTPRYNSNLLGGVTVLEGQALARPAGDWNGRLYRSVAAAPPEKPVAIRLIPYYAWANRGKSEMTVWMPTK